MEHILYLIGIGSLIYLITTIICHCVLKPMGFLLAQSVYHVAILISKINITIFFTIIAILYVLLILIGSYTGL